MVLELYKYHTSKIPLWSKAKYGGTLFSGGAIGATAFNPFRFTWGTSYTYGVPLMFDVGVCSMVDRKDFTVCGGSYVNNFSGVLIPAIFDRWENPDPLTFIFHVREGVLWPAIAPMNRTDRQVTAEDMAWYFEKQRAEGIMGNTFVTVDKFQIVDKLTLKIVHKEPYANFARQLAQTGMGIIPRECFEDKTCLGSKIISPAPFLLESNEVRVKAVWKKNPEFWLKGMPYFDGSVGISIADPSAQKAAFITGKLDHYNAQLDTEKDELVRQTPGAYVISNTCICAVWQTRWALDQPPFNDVRVRRALSMAIDRPVLWQLAANGLSEMGFSIPWDDLGFELPPSLSTTGPYNQYNPTLAKQLMVEAGYPNGFKIEVETFWTSFGLPNTLPGIQDMWKKNLNVEGTYKIVDAVAINTKIAERKFTSVILDYCKVLGCSGTDADSYAQTYYSKGLQNVSRINDPKMDELYLKQRRETNTEKRKEVLWEILRYQWDQQYSIDMMTNFVYLVIQPWVRNAANHTYRYFGATNVAGWVGYIDPDLRPK